jgi:hypothetical protein
MRYLFAAALAAVLAGCGGASKPAAPAASDAAAPPRSNQAPELVNYQRNGGLAATLDTVSVRTDARTRADKRYGGAGRRFDDFRLSAPVMARLRAALRRLPSRVPAGGGAAHGYTYLLHYGDRTLAARQGALPARGRAAFTTLDALVDGGGA